MLCSQLVHPCFFSPDTPLGVVCSADLPRVDSLWAAASAVANHVSREAPARASPSSSSATKAPSSWRDSQPNRLTQPQEFKPSSQPSGEPAPHSSGARGSPQMLSPSLPVPWIGALPASLSGLFARCWGPLVLIGTIFFACFVCATASRSLDQQCGHSDAALSCSYAADHSSAMQTAALRPE